MNIKNLTVNLVNAFTGLVEVFLGLRFILKLFGANPNNGFVGWVYNMSSTLLTPFRGIFPSQVFENKYVLEFTTLFAMLVYAVVALLVVALIDAVTSGMGTKKK